LTSPSNDISKVLWIDDPVKNGYQSDEQYREHILEQYKLYVEMADRISSRRDIANTFFLTLNGLVLGSAGILIEKSFSLSQKWALIFPLAVLLLQCFFWNRLINSFKQLNGVKFYIVGELETRLPASPYRKAEWETLLKEGKDRKVYWPLTHVEAKIPLIFAGAYLFAAIALWFSN
jgi:hypothetical protein